MTAAHVARRLRKIAADAKSSGFALVVDSGESGIRVMTSDEAKADDLRGIGVLVRMHDGCNGGGSDVSGGGRWM